MAILFEITGTSGQGWGASSSTTKQRISQKWVATLHATLTSVEHDIIKNSSPADNLNLNIYSGGSNAENGTLVSGPIVVAGSGIPTGFGTRTVFTLASSLIITSGTTYWFTWTRDTLSDTDNYQSRYTAGAGNAYTYVPVDGGWELITPAADWDIKLIGEPTFIPRVMIF